MDRCISCGRVASIVMFNQCSMCAHRTLQMNQCPYARNNIDMWSIAVMPDNIKPSGSANFSRLPDIAVTDPVITEATKPQTL